MSDEPVDDLDSLDQDLSGGQAVPDGSSNAFAHVVLLEAPSGRPERLGKPEQCSATRIGRRHLLTSAHCIATWKRGAPVTIRHGKAGASLGTFSAHVPLSLFQDPGIDLIGEDYSKADIAVVTLDAREGGYDRLLALQDNVNTWRVDDGKTIWTMMAQLGRPLPLLHIGYGCDQLIPDPDLKCTGAEVLRFGPANVIEWPTALGPPHKDKYLLTRGQEIKPGPTDELFDDQLTGPGVSSMHGDSGGPAMFGGVVGVDSTGVRKPGMTYQINLIAIPDKAWTTRMMRQPVIDVVSSTLADLDPTHERVGKRVHVYPDMEGANVLYVRGHLLNARWSIGDYQVPFSAVQFLPDDAVNRLLDLDTVKITLPADAPARLDLLVARLPDEVVNPDPLRHPLASRSARFVEIHAKPKLTWRRHHVYRALACGDTYGNIVGSCTSPSDLTELTIVHSTVFESLVDDQPVRLEKIESISQATAWDATMVVNLVPDEALQVGSYQYVTTSCSPDGGGCATIHIDYEYQEEEMVDQAGELCRFHKRTYHDIVPWVNLLGERLVVKEFFADLAAALPGFSGVALGVHQDVDSEPTPCGEILDAHPPEAPFFVSEAGVIVPLPGWQRI